MKPTTHIITRARRHCDHVAVNLQWAHAHLYCAIVAFQDGNVATAQKELARANELTKQWKRKATAVTASIREALQSME